MSEDNGDFLLPFFFFFMKLNVMDGEDNVGEVAGKSVGSSSTRFALN